MPEGVSPPCQACKAAPVVVVVTPLSELALRWVTVALAHSVVLFFTAAGEGRCTVLQSRWHVRFHGSLQEETYWCRCVVRTGGCTQGGV